MRVSLENNYISFLFIFAWTLFMYSISIFSLKILLHPGFLGPESWVNFDRANYLLISVRVYSLFQQVYFLFLSLLIYFFFLVTRILATYLISYAAVVFNMLFFIFLGIKSNFLKSSIAIVFALELCLLTALFSRVYFIS